MGGPPYRLYDVFIDVGGRGGGLEHLNSHRFAWARGADPKFAGGLVAHEFFHLWNVKRIRPAILGPFNYSRESPTHLLWASEGVTSYYADLLLERSGIDLPVEFIGRMGSLIDLMEHTPGRRLMSVEEASWDAWLRADNADSTS